ncbi:hypothetical protein FQZ97_920500 [compost metagenome]
MCGFGGGRQVQRCAAGGGGHVAPEAGHTHAEREHHEQEHRREHAHQQVVREQVVEVAGQVGGPQAALHGHREQQEQREAGGERDRQREAVALVELSQRGWPGVVGVGLPPHGGHGLRHVDRKLVRWRVLAGMQAGAAVVAQVGQEVDVGLAEFEPARHGRKHGAEAFAVAAGVADLHLARHLGFGR